MLWTRTPTVQPPSGVGSTRELVPIPPFHPKAIVPVPAPTLPSVVKMLAALDTAIADVMAEKTAVSSALDNAQREMQQLLDADLA